MIQQEKITRNIGLTFDFIDFLIDNPQELDKLPDNFALEFAEKDMHAAQPRQQVWVKDAFEPA